MKRRIFLFTCLGMLLIILTSGVKVNYAGGSGRPPQKKYKDLYTIKQDFTTTLKLDYDLTPLYAITRISSSDGMRIIKIITVSL